MNAESAELAIDPTFYDLGFRKLAPLVLTTAEAEGASHADFRGERIHTQCLAVHDDAIEGTEDHVELGFAVRVIVDGAWGFAASTRCDRESAHRVAQRAVEMARLTRALILDPVKLAPTDVHRDAFWASEWRINPFELSLREKTDLLQSWSSELLRSTSIEHASAAVHLVQENKYYADLSGTSTTQQRLRIEPLIEVFGTRSGRFESMRTLAAPTAREDGNISSVKVSISTRNVPNSRSCSTNDSVHPPSLRERTTSSSIPQTCGSPSTNQ